LFQLMPTTRSLSPLVVVPVPPSSAQAAATNETATNSIRARLLILNQSSSSTFTSSLDVQIATLDAAPADRGGNG
jgi:hypothetical protein